MPLASSITPEQRFFGLFIGRSGSGKTAAALSFPKPIRVFDLDGRIRGGLCTWIDERDKIEYSSFPPKSTKTVFERLNQEFEALQVICNTSSSGPPFQTLVFDSITWATIDLLLDAIPLTHGTGASGQQKGMKLGTMNMAGPEDYKFQSTGIWQVIAFLKSLPIPNIICTAHVVNRWGKPELENGEKDRFAENVIVGEQLSLTDKLAENIPSSFDHVFKFEKDVTGRRFTFEAHGELARTAYENLPFGKIDISNGKMYPRLFQGASKK